MTWPMAWGQAFKTLRNKLQVIQNKTLRSIVNAPWYVRNADLHKEPGIAKITEHLQDLHRKFLQRVNAHPNALIRNTFLQNPNPLRPRTLYKT